MSCLTVYFDWGTTLKFSVLNRHCINKQIQLQFCSYICAIRLVNCYFLFYHSVWFVNTPHCEGLPSGSCSKGTNDKSGRSTQGDLFLCQSCEQACFPSVTDKSKSGRNTRNTRNGNQNPPAQVTQLSTLHNVQCAGCDRTSRRADCIHCDTDISATVFDQQCSTLPQRRPSSNAADGSAATAVHHVKLN